MVMKTLEDEQYVVIKAYKFAVFEIWRDFNVLSYIACPRYPYIRVYRLYDIHIPKHTHPPTHTIYKYNFGWSGREHRNKRWGVMTHTHIVDLLLQLSIPVINWRSRSKTDTLLKVCITTLKTNW